MAQYVDYSKNIKATKKHLNNFTFNCSSLFDAPDEGNKP